LGRPSEAIAPIRRALEIDPGFSAALRTLANAQAGIGQVDDAVALLQQALHARGSAALCSALFLALPAGPQRLLVRTAPPRSSKG
jgi:tetratricopeptide (TPR) repeat protein